MKTIKTMHDFAVESIDLATREKKTIKQQDAVGFFLLIPMMRKYASIIVKSDYNALSLSEIQDSKFRQLRSIVWAAISGRL